MEDKIGTLIPVLSLFIPIIAIVMGIGIGMLAIYLRYRKRKEISAHYHQERMAAIEKGIECPPWPDRLLADAHQPGLEIHVGGGRRRCRDQRREHQHRSHAETPKPFIQTLVHSSNSRAARSLSSHG